MWRMSEKVIKFATSIHERPAPCHKPLNQKCDNSSVGRALASQAEGRGFESRLSLQINTRGRISVDMRPLNHFICHSLYPLPSPPALLLYRTQKAAAHHE